MRSFSSGPQRNSSSFTVNLNIDFKLMQKYGIFTVQHGMSTNSLKYLCYDLIAHVIGHPTSPEFSFNQLWKFAVAQKCDAVQIVHIRAQYYRQIHGSMSIILKFNSPKSKITNRKLISIITNRKLVICNRENSFPNSNTKPAIKTGHPQVKDEISTHDRKEISTMNIEFISAQQNIQIF